MFLHFWTLFLEGPFQSDALLVPEGCLFDHIHNASRCWPFVRWNQTGAAACQERGMQMRSFAMLLPCGISLFSGVEFVCCPKHLKGKGHFDLENRTRFKERINTANLIQSLLFQFPLRRFSFNGKCSFSFYFLRHSVCWYFYYKHFSSISNIRFSLWL